MVDWSIILCANNHKTGNGTGTGRRTVTTYIDQFFFSLFVLHVTTSSHSRRHPDQRLKSIITILSIREASVVWRFFLAQLEFGFSFVFLSEVYCHIAQLSGVFWWIIFGLGPVIFDQAASVLNYLGSSGESSSDWDLSFLINQLQLLFTTFPDAVRNLCRPHVPFVRCNKGCPR